MATSSLQQLCIALSKDFNQAGSKPKTAVVDDAARKTFTAHKDCVVFEFPHKQPDINFWSGVKYYGGGKRNKIRIRRSQIESV